MFKLIKKKSLFFALNLALVLFAANYSANAQISKKTMDFVASQMVSLRGKIVIKAVGKEEFITVPNMNIYFQRTNCKTCIIAAMTDPNGEYQLLVSKGKYRVFVFTTDENNIPIKDVVSTKQRRIIDTNQKIPETFDIEITEMNHIYFPILEL